MAELNEYIYVVIVIIIISIVFSHYYLKNNIQTSVESTVKKLTDVDTDILAKLNTNIISNFSSMVSSDNNGNTVLKKKTIVKDLLVDSLPTDTFDSGNGNLVVTGTTTTNVLNAKGNVSISGNLIVDGDISFTNKNTKIMNIFPRYMVIAWANAKIPSGWALCDGAVYDATTLPPTLLSSAINKLSNRNSYTDETSYILTPDLRGRFILGSGEGFNYDTEGKYTTKLVNRTINDVGGEENHKLDENEMPSHSHKFGRDKDGNNGPSNAGLDLGGDKGANTLDGETAPAGGNNPHNNMPPYWVLTYIMKL